MPKMMPEFDPKNDPEMNKKGTKGGAPEVRRTSLRGWPAGFSYLKRLTPAGVGGLSTLRAYPPTRLHAPCECSRRANAYS